MDPDLKIRALVVRNLEWADIQLAASHSPGWSFSHHWLDGDSLVCSTGPGGLSLITALKRGLSDHSPGAGSQ